MKLNNFNFSKYLNKNFVFENNPSIAVALSGGPDSMALLFLLNYWVRKNGGKLIALIVDHKLRIESKNEAKKISKQLDNLKITNKILNIKKSYIKKRNMAEARLNRYNVLTEYCKKNNILHLFIGHHEDDNIETYLTRRIGGSDFEGLSSIKNYVIRNKVSILRPLLKFSKKEILEYNNKNKINYIKDPSNTNFLYTRPIIRKFLSDSNLSIRNSICKDFDLIRNNIINYKNMINEIIINTVLDTNKNFISIDLKNFISYQTIVIEKIVRKNYEFFFGDSSNIRSKKIHIFIDQLKNENFRIFIIKNMLIKKDKNKLIFSRKST